MEPLRQAATSSDVQQLIDNFYTEDVVHGIALGIHGNYLELYRQQFGSEGTLDSMLASPTALSRWGTECEGEDFPSSLSPIYVVLYVSMDPEDFRRQYPTVPQFTEVNRFAVYVERRASFEALSGKRNYRPLLGGISVSGDKASTAGTLGGHLQANETSDHYLLSCYHVLKNATNSVRAVQRGRSDGGTAPADVVGKIDYSITLTPSVNFTYAAPFYKVDAAIATLLTNITPDPFLRILKRVVRGTKPIAQISLGDTVVFVGKESDDRQSKVYRHIARLKWNWNGNTYNFGDVFEIEPRQYSYFGTLAKPGDSGSWVVKEHSPEELECYGMLFAGSGLFAVCCYMENVLLELNAEAQLTFDYL